MCKIEPGKKYHVIHARKGQFDIRADQQVGTLVTGTITKGCAHFISESNRGPGDSITMDIGRPLITLYPMGE